MNSNIEMDQEERNKRLKEVGLYVPKQNLAELNKEMERIAKDNYKKMIEENLKKKSQNEVLTLKKLGLTNEQIAHLGEDENPFKDYSLGEREDVSDLLEA